MNVVLTWSVPDQINGKMVTHSPEGVSLRRKYQSFSSGSCVDADSV